MSAAEFLHEVWRHAFVLNAALLVVLGLRHITRRLAGANVAYALWLLVPVSMLGLHLPSREARLQFAPVAAVALKAPSIASTPVTDVASPLLTLAWLVGALLTAALFARRQSAFVASLRLPRPHRRVQVAGAEAPGLPATVGVLRPRVVLPRLFRARYDASERLLMLRHERAHLRTGDPLFNALLAALRCAFWFNPLLHWAAGRFHHDQELACDARVLHQRPGARRTYADAMLKTQLASQALPLGCHWGRTHPLRERIEMLGLTFTATRRRGGLALVTLACAAGMAAAWAGSPSVAGAGDTQMAMVVRINGGEPQQSASRFALADSSHVFTFSDDSDGWSMEVDVKPDGAGRYELDTVLTHQGVEVSHPKMIVNSGQWSGIKTGEEDDKGGFKGFEAQLVVAPADQPIAPAPGAIGEAPAPGNDVTVTNAALRIESSTPAPLYPAEAVAKGISGRVVLLMDVDASGRVTEVEVEQSQPAGVFDANAVQAAKQWRLTPLLEKGRPVAGRVRVPVTFEAPKPPKA